MADPQLLIGPGISRVDIAGFYPTLSAVEVVAKKHRRPSHKTCACISQALPLLAQRAALYKAISLAQKPARLHSLRGNRTKLAVKRRRFLINFRYGDPIGELRIAFAKFTVLEFGEDLL